MRKRQQEVEQCNRSRLHHTIVNDFWIAVECRDQGRRCCINHSSDQLGNNDGTEDAEPRTFFRTVVLLCTKVLADECRQRHRKARNRKERKALDFCIRTAACHRHLSEGVDVGLHKNVRNRDYGVLKARRHAVPDDLAEHSAVKPDFADVKLILFFRPHQVDQAENRTRKL